MPSKAEYELRFKLLERYWEAAKDGGLENAKRDIVEFYLMTINERARELVDTFRQMMDEIVDAYNKQGKEVLLARAETTYRLRHGTSNYLPPLEWGLTLHPIFGVPYLPASSVKGALRASLYSVLIEKLKVSLCNDVEKRFVSDCLSEEKERELFDLLEKIAAVFFGASEKRGMPSYLVSISPIIVADAYPTRLGRCNRLVIGDVLTPHYSTTKELVDELDVKLSPLVGPSVDEKVEFTFVIAIDKSMLREKLDYLRELLRELGNINNNNDNNNDFQEFYNNFLDRLQENAGVVIGSLLMKAFIELGVGGKTSRGYGRFQMTELKLFR